jgi:hypothetical protein
MMNRRVFKGSLLMHWWSICAIYRRSRLIADVIHDASAGRCRQGRVVVALMFNRVLQWLGHGLMN